MPVRRRESRSAASDGIVAPVDDPFADLPTVAAADSSLPGTLELGAFSVSLTVADLNASREFYEHLGFEVTGGAPEADYLIMKNGETTLGLFHGMFDTNILTFNPGLTNRMERLDHFTDLRAVQAALDEAGIEIVERADPATTGPASITVVDPDGNAILIDQFF
jgi:catechol 2,3-dioxygenase-like lactoylglutathione lyase family enzyme